MESQFKIHDPQIISGASQQHSVAAFSPKLEAADLF